MRKFIVLFTVIVLAMFSCKSKPNQPQDNGNTVESLYHFYIDSGKLYKLNLISGDESTVCTDPVCLHDESCFFSEVNYVCPHGNTIYFSRSDAGSVTSKNGVSYITESICSFDYSSGKSAELCRIKSGSDSSLQGMLEYHDGYVYFYRRTPNPEISEFSLYRVNSTGGEPEDMGLSVPMWHGAHFGDRLYFFDNVDTLYSTDIHGENRVDEVVLDSPGRIVLMRDTSDGFLYYSTIYSDSNEIWRENLADVKHEKLFETSDGIILSLYKTDDGLYFLISSDEFEFAQTSDGRALKDSYGGKVYRLDFGSKKCETVYDNPDTHINYLRKCGNSIVVFSMEVSGDDIVTNRFVVND